MINVSMNSIDQQLKPLALERDLLYETRSQGGVVDDKLSVYGVRNLKVADLSIIPSNVGANTYNTTIAIGEKAALIIAAELGIIEMTASKANGGLLIYTLVTTTFLEIYQCNSMYHLGG
ncbi:hypothetical protein BJ912DRAFT_602165 [Pholiota molesta]|nr:hypothetical protein BJ912DRAFT_602165 [Pholiota molesta]